MAAQRTGEMERPWSLVDTLVESRIVHRFLVSLMSPSPRGQAAIFPSLDIEGPRANSPIATLDLRSIGAIEATVSQTPIHPPAASQSRLAAGKPSRPSCPYLVRERPKTAENR